MAEVSRAQGLLLGRLADVGMALRAQASLAALTEGVLKTSEIGGEPRNVESVRSSIARRLGVDVGALAAVDRHVEGPASSRVRFCRESRLAAVTLSQLSLRAPPRLTAGGRAGVLHSEPPAAACPVGLPALTSPRRPALG